MSNLPVKLSLAVIGLLCAGVGVQADRPLAKRYQKIQIFPSSVTLNGSATSGKFIVSALDSDGFWCDVTSQAKFISPPCLMMQKDGSFRPASSGRGFVSARLNGLEAKAQFVVGGIQKTPVSFVRDVMPILARTGCNQGTCHGSAKGKNGFKLSLRGYDPDYDYKSLIDDISGRRFNRVNPAQSLMLLKPTQGVAHQGGLVFDENSPAYSVIYRWIAEGVKNDSGKVARANRIEVLPDKPKMRLSGEQQPLLVLAHYPDGATKDVTAEAVFTSTMPEVVTVSPEGVVTSMRRGEASVLVRYEGNYAANRLTVIGDRTGYKFVAQPRLNYIDKWVDKKLISIKSSPSGLCTDSEFLRRAYIDITGVPPTASAVREYLADPSPSQLKRSKLINQLIASSDYADNWTNKWSDLLSVNRKFLGERGVWKFRNWLHKQISENRPYDEFVRDIVTATGSTFDNPAGSYWRVAREPNQAAENVTQLFLGIRFSCNKCHDHPFERWTQTQYYQFAANFGRIGYGASTAEGDETILERKSGEVVHPRLNKVMTAGYPYSVKEASLSTDNRRVALAGWLTSKSNPLFAKSYVNRIWSYFLGKGIIDPVDDIRSSNPPVNPELLEALTAEFIQNGFDTKQLIRRICNSRTYQSSIKSNHWNMDDSINFSHAIPRRLTAEQLVDALSMATGSVKKYGGVPSGFRAVQLPDSSTAGSEFLDLFGRPVRESPCECERSSAVSLGQALNLINSDTINYAVSDKNGLVARLVSQNLPDSKLLEELFLSALCRMPTIAERTKFLPALNVSSADVDNAIKVLPANANADRSKVTADMKNRAAQDILWALVNSPAFLFNR